MSNDITIRAAIATGKEVAMEWADKFIANDAIGESNGCCELRLVVLTRWIKILEGYLDENFNSDGSDKTAEYECLTLDEALEIVSKINLLEC